MTFARRRPAMRRHGAAACMMTVAALLAAGCTGSADTPRGNGDQALAVGTPSAVAAPSLQTVTGVALPTAAYKPTAAEQSVVGDAEERLIADCMRQFGFTWKITHTNTSDVNQLDRAYGVSDLAVAQRYGYHLPPSYGKGKGGPGAAAARGTSLSPSELLVLSGSTTGDDATGERQSYGGRQIPPGGCAAEARRNVTGVDQIDPERAADAITVAMFEKSKADPRVVAAVRSWSECMKDSGYQYQSPLQVGGDHPEWLQRAQPGAAEIQTAVTDVRCKQRTNLIGIWFGLESAYENAAIQQHIEQLTDIKDRWRAAARKAAGILGVQVPS